MKLISHEESPFNAEAPLDALDASTTPTSLFYVRSHYAVPELDADRWRLTVDGCVGRTLVLSLPEITHLPAHSVTMTMECAGNGRALMTPTPPGTPWRLGAVSTARFTGAPLHLLLDAAGVRADAVEALFVGADGGETTPGRTDPFMRSLPLEVARHPDTILAWAMNGEPLPPDHGFPLRLVVPGWYGVASVKWLVRIGLIDRPFEGYFQKARYVYAGDPIAPEGAPVAQMRVRALIVRPGDGANLAPGPIEVTGVAWSGAGAVRRVRVSTDGGQTWTDAELKPADSPWSAVPWRLLWRPAQTGEVTLVARAEDDAGHTQPLTPIHNVHGYGNNVVHRVTVTVR